MKDSDSLNLAQGGDLKAMWSVSANQSLRISRGSVITREWIGPLSYEWIGPLMGGRLTEHNCQILRTRRDQGGNWSPPVSRPVLSHEWVILKLMWTVLANQRLRTGRGSRKGLVFSSEWFQQSWDFDFLFATAPRTVLELGYKFGGSDNQSSIT